MYRVCSTMSCVWLMALIVGLCLGGLEPRSALAFSQSWDFEGPVGRDWSTTDTFNVGGNRILGLFNDQKVEKYAAYTTLAIQNIPAGVPLVVSFDLYLIGSWDSEGKLADRWSLGTKDGATLLEITRFDDVSPSDRNPRPAAKTGKLDTGRRFLEYSSVTHRVTIPPEAIKNGTISLVFRGYLTGKGTEFWALDNVRIEAADK